MRLHQTLTAEPAEETLVTVSASQEAARAAMAASVAAREQHHRPRGAGGASAAGGPASGSDMDDARSPAASPTTGRAAPYTEAAEFNKLQQAVSAMPGLSAEVLSALTAMFPDMPVLALSDALRDHKVCALVCLRAL